MPALAGLLAGPEAPRQGPGLGPRRGERRLGRLLLGSALLHLLMVALVILASLRWKAPPEPVSPPSVEILFVPAPGPQKRPPGPPQASQPATQPATQPAPRAVPAPAPVPPRPATPPVAAPMPHVPQPVPPGPLPAPSPAPARPQPEAPPAVSLQAPGAATFAAPPPPVPIPVPIPVPTPAPLPPAPARRPSDAAFAHPMDFSLHPAAPGANGLDLSFSGSNLQSALRPLTEMRSDQVGRDWMALFSAWLDAHASYPEAAGEAGQQGTVRVRFVVTRDGTVRSVQLVRSAHSPWLDMAPAAWLRGARLPPLPPGTKEGEATVDLTIRFVIVRH